jgi:hypothetical protein
MKWIAGFLVPVFRAVLKPFPAIRARLGRTLGGRSGAVFRLLEKKAYAEAFKQSLEGVMQCESQRAAFDMQKMYWWNFMECAALSATQLGEAERQQVLARLGNAPEPGALLEARTLEILSRWRWSAGDAEGAIELARRAVLADATWPQGHIILAWYGLVSGKFDPLPRLREAVRVAPSCLEQIRATADFAKFPELIAALTASGG